MSGAFCFFRAIFSDMCSIWPCWSANFSFHSRALFNFLIWNNLTLYFGLNANLGTCIYKLRATQFACFADGGGSKDYIFFHKTFFCHRFCPLRYDCFFLFPATVMSLVFYLSNQQKVMITVNVSHALFINLYCGWSAQSRQLAIIF